MATPTFDRRLFLGASLALAAGPAAAASSRAPTGADRATVFVDPGPEGGGAAPAATLAVRYPGGVLVVLWQREGLTGATSPPIQTEVPCIDGEVQLVYRQSESSQLLRLVPGATATCPGGAHVSVAG